WKLERLPRHCRASTEGLYPCLPPPTLLNSEKLVSLAVVEGVRQKGQSGSIDGGSSPAAHRRSPTIPPSSPLAERGIKGFCFTWELLDTGTRDRLQILPQILLVMVEPRDPFHQLPLLTTALIVYKVPGQDLLELANTQGLYGGFAHINNRTWKRHSIKEAKTALMCEALLRECVSKRMYLILHLDLQLNIQLTLSRSLSRDLKVKVLCVICAPSVTMRLLSRSVYPRGGVRLLTQHQIYELLLFTACLCGDAMKVQVFPQILYLELHKLPSLPQDAPETQTHTAQPGLSVRVNGAAATEALPAVHADLLPTREKMFYFNGMLSENIFLQIVTFLVRLSKRPPQALHVGSGAVGDELVKPELYRESEVAPEKQDDHKSSIQSSNICKKQNKKSDCEKQGAFTRSVGPPRGGPSLKRPIPPPLPPPPPPPLRSPGRPPPRLLPPMNSSSLYPERRGREGMLENKHHSEARRLANADSSVRLRAHAGWVWCLGFIQHAWPNVAGSPAHPRSPAQPHSHPLDAHVKARHNARVKTGFLPSASTEAPVSPVPMLNTLCLNEEMLERVGTIAGHTSPRAAAIGCVQMLLFRRCVRATASSGSSPAPASEAGSLPRDERSITRASTGLDIPSTRFSSILSCYNPCTQLSED
ncbi:hypothetical protein DNTS_006336, partial [Danionella cerebrum]